MPPLRGPIGFPYFVLRALMPCEYPERDIGKGEKKRGRKINFTAVFKVDIWRFQKWEKRTKVQKYSAEKHSVLRK